MKKLFYILFFSVGISNAQIVNIPDANFKAALISNGVDANSDGNIQESEALAVIVLDFFNYPDISDLTGIGSFTNLEQLYFDNNQITSFDFGSLTNLSTLYIENNPLTSLNVSNLPSLQNLFCANNQIATPLILSGNTNLLELHCDANLIPSIDISGCSALTSFFANANPQLQSVNASGCSSLTGYLNAQPSISLDVSNCSSLLHVGPWDLPQFQNLNITGCTSLQSVVITSSQLTQLDLSGFQNMSIVSLNNSPLSTINFTGCTNLTYLDLSNTQLSSLDASNNPLLDELYLMNTPLEVLNVSNCSSLTNLGFVPDTAIASLNVSNCSSLQNVGPWFAQQLQFLDVSGCTNLIGLTVGATQLTQLDASGLTNLSILSCGGSPITDINLTGCSNLTYVNVSDTQLTSLDVSNNPFLTELYLDASPIENLDVSNCSSLTSLNMNSFPGLSTLNVLGCSSLTGLDCSDTQLTTLDISNLTALDTLYCNYNFSLASINTTNCNNLATFQCAFNQLTTLDVSTLSSLNDFNCIGNQLTTIDLSNNSNLTLIDLSSNQLETIFMKNGSNETGNLSDNPNLSFVCCDESQLTDIQNLLITQGFSTTVCNSYCSFIPGGNYNTLTGTILFDSDNNGCDTNDTSHPNIRIDINDGTNQGATFTEASGVFNFYTDAGSFTINPNVENPTWFTLSPTSATIPFADNNNNVATQNFCLSAVGIHADVEVVIAPIIPARPGFDAVYHIVYKNKGNQTVSGVVSFTYDDSVLDFVSVSIAPTTQSPNVLNWNYVDLLPFETRSIYVTLNVNSPTDTPAVNIDDVLIFDAGITSSITDEFVDDNSFTYNQTVVGSFDPNDIVCVEGDSLPVSEIGEYLHYVINFENTGNSEAENIVVRTEIDATEFDLNSLQMLNTSHDAYIRQNENVVEFVFQNIALQSGGHGNVLLKIKTNYNLQNGTTVGKQATIYFDYNAPIETNSANTTFETLSSGSFEVDNSIVVYPNPTASLLNINCKNNIKTVQLYDVQGRLLQTHIVNDANTLLDISDKSNGIYFAKITSEVGVKVEKIIKE